MNTQSSAPFRGPKAGIRPLCATLLITAFACVHLSVAASPPFLRNLEVEGNLTVIDGRESLDGVVFYGAFGGLSAIPETGPGTRFMWYPRKAALRAGQVDGTEWNEAEIGEFSVAMGLNPIASGRSAIALGEDSRALGDGSAAIGDGTSALGTGAFAVGVDSHADGDGVFVAGMDEYVVGPASVSLGSGNTILGNGGNVSAGSKNVIHGSDRSFALGHANIIDSAADAMAFGRENFISGVAGMAFGRNLENSVFSSLVVGSYNEPLEGGVDDWICSDPLFVIGNGSSGQYRSNALVVRKSGDTEVYGTLEVAEDVIISGDLSVEGTFLSDTYLPDDLNVIGNIKAAGGVASQGELKAKEGIMSERFGSGEIVTAFAGGNRSDEAGSGVRIALSSSLNDGGDAEEGATVDAVLQSGGSHDLILSSASKEGLNEIVRLGGSDRSAVIDGDTYINGDLAIDGEVTIARVPPQGGIMMGEFGSAE